MSTEHWRVPALDDGDHVDAVRLYRTSVWATPPSIGAVATGQVASWWRLAWHAARADVPDALDRFFGRLQ
jgi:hypothetical protein